VYELAERLRATRGGAAVVLGALSPRTRNAQVAMYQAGEVDYLVATDAIGMGLNLAVDHVAFAGFCKFDGSEERELRPRELGQIAGRAGRHTSPGTFGTLREGPRMPEQVARAIESHRFEPERLAFWRNADLDTSSIDTLLQSLTESPRGRLLRRFVDGDDTRALRRLANVAWVADACTREDRVRLLWTVCQVPDYRKLLPELHAELLLEVFKQLLEHHGALQDAWLEKHVAALDDPRGDVDTLTSRIAAVRTFTYLSQQPGFVANQKAWSERTRAVEDRLSDALHDALIQRFVDRSRRTHVDRGAGFAQLERRLSVMLEKPSDDDWVQAVIAAPSDAIDVLPNGRIEHDGRELARLSAGKSLLLPEVRALATELPPGLRAQLTRRLVAFSRDLRDRVARDWYREDGSAAERGLCYQLLENLGSIERRAVEAQLAALAANEREALQLRGVVVGSRFVWVKALLGHPALMLRSALVAVCAGEPLPDLARAPASLHRPARLDARWALRLGYAALGPRWVRCDLAERAISQCVDGSDPGTLCGILGCRKSELKAVLEALAVTQVGAKESSTAAARLNR
jgi:ATP-dependent RNA helicase SUPV3L1/SUV3